MERARAAGARPFEVITGSPHARYGVRITFETFEEIRDDVAARFSLSTHPWGPPDWIGLRVSPSGDVVWKAYHRFDRIADTIAAPHTFMKTVVPVMASRHDGMDELYFRRGNAGDWICFVNDLCSAMQIDPVLPKFSPLPRARADSFCLSVKAEGDRVIAVSCFADDRALPDDRRIAIEWAGSLAANDRAAYQAALAGVRAFGVKPARGWHAMLAWTVDRRHGWSQAASLRIR